MKKQQIILLVLLIGSQDSLFAMGRQLTRLAPTAREAARRTFTTFTPGRQAINPSLTQKPLVNPQLSARTPNLQQQQRFMSLNPSPNLIQTQPTTSGFWQYLMNMFNRNRTALAAATALGLGAYGLKGSAYAQEYTPEELYEAYFKKYEIPYNPQISLRENVESLINDPELFLRKGDWLYYMPDMQKYLAQEKFTEKISDAIKKIEAAHPEAGTLGFRALSGLVRKAENNDTNYWNNLNTELLDALDDYTNVGKETEYNQGILEALPTKLKKFVATLEEHPGLGYAMAIGVENRQNLQQKLTALIETLKQKDYHTNKTLYDKTIIKLLDIMKKEGMLYSEDYKNILKLVESPVSESPNENAAPKSIPAQPQETKKTFWQKFFGSK